MALAIVEVPWSELLVSQKKELSYFLVVFQVSHIPDKLGKRIGNNR